ncbi:MAG TPA: hypothetical protein VN519_17680 [Bryobacteraceae bacterium]|nr:hypothetical protein [Bryobacteraceae bacterium]
MSKNFIQWVAMGALVGAMALAAYGQGQGAATRAQPKTPAGPAPKTPEGKPDFSGLWERPYVPDMTAYGRNQTPDESLPDDPKLSGRGPNAKHNKLLPFTAKGKAMWDSYDAASNGDYTGSCMPFGAVRSVNSPDPLQIMQNAKYVGFLWEQNTWFHIARFGEHTKVPTPLWFGDTTARWDGDTMVLDSTNFNGRIRLDTNGHPTSDKLHVIERYSRPDMGHINYEITIDDPEYYTRPWKNTRVFTLRPDWEIMEYSCEENNKDFFEGHIKRTQNPNAPAVSK